MCVQPQCSLAGEQTFQVALIEDDLACKKSDHCIYKMSDNTSFEAARKDGAIPANPAGSLQKEHAMVSARHRNNTVIARTHHLREHHSYANTINIPANPEPASTAFSSSNSEIRFKIDESIGVKYKSLVFRITLSETGGANNVVVCPANYFFDRIVFYAVGGSGNEIQRLAGEDLLLRAGMLLRAHEKNAVLTNMGYTASTYAPSALCTIAAGASATFYLELTNTFVDTSEYLNDAANSPIEVKLFTRTGGIVSSGSGTLALSKIDLWVEHEELPSFDRQLHLDAYRKAAIMSRYLDVVHVRDVRSLAAGAETKVDLQSVIGKVACLAIMVRAGSNPVATSTGLTTYTDLKDDGLVDLLTSSNTPVLGRGSKIPIRLLRNSWFNKYAPGDISNTLAGVYVIPFCDIEKAAHGFIDGYYYMNGTKNQLSITPGTGFSTATHTIDIYAYVFNEMYFSRGELRAIRA